MFNALKKYLVKNKVAAAPVTKPVVSQIIQQQPAINQNLYQYFSTLPIKQFTPAKLYHGGAHLPGAPVKGTLWMCDNYLCAESYKNWGKPIDSKLLPMVLEAEPTKTLDLIEFGGNHIDILQGIYGGSWSHAKFHKDFVQLIELGKLKCDGLYRPRSDEYFIVNVEENLKFIQ